MTWPTFANPWWLLLVPAVPLLVWAWLRGGQGALLFPEVAPLRGFPPGRAAAARRGGALLRGGALALLVVALAGPRWPDPGTRIPTEGIAIGMVVDVSGSMAEPDYFWQDEPVTRLEAVQRAFRLFVAGGAGAGGTTLPGRPNDLIALVAFAARPESVCPLTLSHDVLLQLLDAERPRTVPTEARTNLGDALAWGLHRLQGAGTRRKILVLLTDGEHNVGDPALRPRQAAQLAGNLGVPVYVIDAGGDPDRAGAAPPEGGPAADRAGARKTLGEVARITGGRYFQAHDAAALLEACAEIDRLERGPVESFRYRRYYDGYGWFALGSFALWAALVSLENTRWRRVP